MGHIGASVALPAKREEKKVEYLELIYDLIFVYIIGRNNSLLHSVTGGFVSLQQFLAYAIGTLAVIQIWNFSTYYINMFGRNGVRDHVFLFVNMYLLYYIGEGTRLRWEGFWTQYHVAWALILANIALQYAIELRHHRDAPDAARTIRRMIATLVGEAVLVLAATWITAGGFPVMTLAAILFGMAMTGLLGGEKKASLVDFGHLSERAMLYVVFTFGEMIIAIASYFEGWLTLNSVYFSLMAFLIVVALFLGYEVLYNRIIDRTRTDSGLGFMLIHIFLVFAMNNLTTALEFMQDTAVRLWPKTLFLLGAFLLYYLCLIALMRFARKGLGLCRRFLVPALAVTAAFVAGMLILRENMFLNIALSVAYVYAMFALMLVFARRACRDDECDKEV